MKKIIIALAPIDSILRVTTIATEIAKNHSADIHLVFLSLPTEKLDYGYPFPNDLSSAEDFPDGKNITDSNEQLIEDKLKLFKEECASAQISFSFEKNISLEQLIKETTDADLLVADRSADFLPKVLPHLHCPAFIAAEDHLPEKVVLMFKNSASSKFAIENYISLLPEFKNFTTWLLSINPDDEKENGDYLTNLKSSFTDISMKSLHGKVEKETEHFLSEISGHILVIMGSFGRSEISRFFHESLANSVMEEKGVSLFIAHK